MLKNSQGDMAHTDTDMDTWIIIFKIIVEINSYIRQIKHNC